MGIKIRLGKEEDINSLVQLYDNINDHLAANINYTGWRKGIYPAREDGEKGIEEGSLFVATEDEKIVGSIILRHEPEPAYLSAPWQVTLDNAQVLVIYTFVVSPEKLNQGIGKLLLDFAEKYAEENNVRALRLDVYEKNVPAIHLYEKCGYKYIDTVSLGLEEYGLDWFKLYEKLI